MILWPTTLTVWLRSPSLKGTTVTEGVGGTRGCEAGDGELGREEASGAHAPDTAEGGLPRGRCYAKAALARGEGGEEGMRGCVVANRLELSRPMEAGKPSLLYGTPAGQAGITSRPARRVSCSELLLSVAKDFPGKDAYSLVNRMHETFSAFLDPWRQRYPRHMPRDRLE